ncbi:hypothetical protein [Psychrobacillus sp. FSL H8-0510]|uniref:hypothetical protein n=1 Tax=Psychrobacillus sp. FSL H8-0510 TaxID=2921394 RepID=UPI0030FB8657
MKKQRKLNQFEKDNNEELIKMFNEVNTAGFKADLTVMDHMKTLYKGTVVVELMIGNGIELHFDEKEQNNYLELGLDVIYLLNEVPMKFTRNTTNESYGWLTQKTFQIMLESGKTINISAIE